MWPEIQQTMLRQSLQEAARRSWDPNVNNPNAQHSGLELVKSQPLMPHDV